MHDLTDTTHPEYNVHRHIDELCRRAVRLAPVVADNALDSGCTDVRPGNDRPRAQRAWDLVAEAHRLNMSLCALCDKRVSTHDLPASTRFVARTNVCDVCDPAPDRLALATAAAENVARVLDGATITINDVDLELTIETGHVVAARPHRHDAAQRELDGTYDAETDTCAECAGDVVHEIGGSFCTTDAGHIIDAAPIADVDHEGQYSYAAFGGQLLR